MELIGEAPVNYLGNPQKVEWQAYLTAANKNEKEQPRWHASEFLKDGLLWKAVVYLGSSKATRIYNYNNRIVMSGQERFVKLDITDFFADSPDQRLEELDSIAARKGVSDNLKYTYDQQGKLLVYKGFTSPQNDLGRLPIAVKCSYPNDSTIISNSVIEFDGGTIMVQTKYKFDSAKRLISITDISTSSLFPSNSKKASQTSLKRYTYSPDGRSADFDQTDASGNKVLSGQILFDANGRLIRVMTAMSGRTSGQSWKYDQRGNWIEYIETIGNKPLNIIRRTFTY